MSRSVYTKEGRAHRLEIDRGLLHRLTLEERGEAVERPGEFHCTSLAGALPRNLELRPIPDSLEHLLVRMEAECERAIVTTGGARHTYRDPRAERSWGDEVVRLYASLVNRRIGFRCELDWGSTVFTRSAETLLENVWTALRRAEPGMQTPRRIGLDPAVSATLIAFLLSSKQTRGVAISQIPREGELDGRGERVQHRDLSYPVPAEAMAWFRPSYRIPPRLLPHGVRMEASETAAFPETRAVALAGAPAIEESRVLLRCLITAENRSSLAMIAIDLDRWNEQVAVAEGEAEWFPYVAGVWGRRLVVTMDR